MATPVRMKPSCDMEEQARVLLRLTEKTPRTAPRTIVTRAGSNRIRAQVGSWRNRVALSIRMPKTPVLVRRPESSALEGAGAAA